MNLYPQYNAFLTNGKGSAYRTYTSYPYTNASVIYKARIKKNRLYLSGTYSSVLNGVCVTPRKYSVKGKSFKLTSSTKYYRHVGNNNFYQKSSKAKMKKLLAGGGSSYGGDISFSLKGNKVTLLIAQAIQ